jgi:5-amino-6-(5-phosphoribosylamino)uracil reductase
VINRPHVLLSVAASIDGYIDDNTDDRLLLSNDEDFDRVDSVRAQSDAILVGAGTIRADNPRLLVRSADRQKERTASGKPSSPIKVTITGDGNLTADYKFFTAGDDVTKLVYTTTAAVEKLTAALGSLATVIDAGNPINLDTILTDLHNRGVEQLMVEGGSTIHTQFLESGYVDDLHLVIAPFFIGDHDAAPFVRDGKFPFNPGNRLALKDVQKIGDVALLHYRRAQ